MTSLKAIKTRLASVKSTLKITSAMKMVASAKLRKAQSSIAGKLPYEQELHRILVGMLGSGDVLDALAREIGLEDGASFPLQMQQGASDTLPSKSQCPRVAIVVFSSNSSLCGSFNSDIIKEFRHLCASLSERGYSNDDIDVYAIGRKVEEAVRKDGFRMLGDYHIMSEKPSYEAASRLASSIVDRFISGEVGQVIFVYSHFESSVSQPVVRENYLPLSLDIQRNDDKFVDYKVEPEPLAVVRQLLPMVLMMKFYTVLLDANASEHAARTIAMQVASDNAQKLIAELTLAYNKGRQSEITSEILDLIGGSMS